ncbi:spore germination protein, partial [Enterobacter sp. JH602]
GFIFSLVVPSLYISLTTMHHEMYPTPLALQIAGSRSGVPFPAIVEALLMELSFELLREAGIRLPKAAGQAVSIVGALIIG